MSIADPKPIFDVARKLKGSPLTQKDVDDINVAIAIAVSGIVQDTIQPGLKPSQKAIDLIHSFESCRLTAYKDPGSKDGRPHTIGWGSTGPDIHLGMTWTQQQADERFARDLEMFGDRVAALVAGVATSQNEFDALVSFAYNVGLDALAGSTLLRMHRGGDKAGAALQFARWNKNDGKVMNGLIRRRAAEAALYRGQS